MAVYKQLGNVELDTSWQRGDVYSQLGVVQLRMGLVWSAAMSFERALLHCHRRHTTALEFLGLLHMANGRLDIGRRLHEELLLVLSSQRSKKGSEISTGIQQIIARVKGRILWYGVKQGEAAMKESEEESEDQREMAGTLRWKAS